MTKPITNKNTPALNGNRFNHKKHFKPIHFTKLKVIEFSDILTTCIVNMLTKLS